MINQWDTPSKITDPGRDEKLRDLENVQRATFNILEDFDVEKAYLEDTQRAFLNILQDFETEKFRLESTQKASVNILEDFNMEKLQLEDMQKATLNILEDFDIERVKAEHGEQLSILNKELETILHVSAHDLKEPLRSVETFSSWIHDQYTDRLDEQGKDFLIRIQKGCGRMRQLLDDLLTFSKARRIETPAEEIEGSLVVKNVLESLAINIHETAAIVTVTGPFPKIRVNLFWATRALINLVQNSLKFIPKGSKPDIEIAAYEPSKRSDRRGFVVKDRGFGIEPDQVDQIFELFQRGVGREIEGTGAGLAIVQAIARQYGGDTWYQPREGGGSEFYVTF